MVEETNATSHLQGLDDCVPSVKVVFSDVLIVVSFGDSIV